MNRQQVAASPIKGRQAKKKLEVLDVASDYFLAHGYQGTSINVMARDSGISKESIYRYFSSKQELFEAVIAKELAEYAQKLQQLDVGYQSSPLEESLTKMAESILSVVSTDRTLNLRRLIFQESTASPDIGRYYYEVGPRIGYGNLEKVFAFHKDRFRLPPDKLAIYFIAMLLHPHMLRRQCAVAKPFSKDEIADIAQEVTGDFTDAFLK